MGVFCLILHLKNLLLLCFIFIFSHFRWEKRALWHGRCVSGKLRPQTTRRHCPPTCPLLPALKRTSSQGQPGPESMLLWSLDKPTPETPTSGNKKING